MVMRKKRSDSKKSISIAIAGGGAGGYVYSGIAVAKEIKRQMPSSRILFIGTKKGVEAKIVPHEGFPLETIEIQRIKGKGLRNKFKLLFGLPREVYWALKLLKKFRPSVVFGIGGDVSVPVIYAAYLRRVPTIILEPNRKPTLANRLLSGAVDKIATCFEESIKLFPKKKVIMTGNPVRKEFFLVGETPPPDKGRKINILIVAGTRGARSINYTMIGALDFLGEYRDRLTFTHQTGNADFEYVKSGYNKKQFRADVYQYIKDIPKMYAKAHLVISRAGATTVAELKASGRPAILIPYSRGDKHQESNALAMKDAGMAKVLFQRQFSSKSLSEAILHTLEHPEELAQVWPNNKRLEKRDATEQLVHACLELATGKNSHEMEF
jgi:UDP-N-acetylglucosamine--N-acetylmuramyl-(pentapeptide) pyrophosphoryl-undecaprenol N-acetylglucosamine transferase